MDNERLILVDQRDVSLGEAGKKEVHEKGLLHRAFSVFIFNTRGELLLQRRALGKYHSAGLWANTCCSHPRPGEDTLEAAKRRLKEEMGMEADLKKEFEFIYRAVLGNGLIEHEFDHVYTGISDQDPCINPAEVSEWSWMDPETLKAEMGKFPEHYTAWLRIAFLRF